MAYNNPFLAEDDSVRYTVLYQLFANFNLVSHNFSSSFVHIQNLLRNVPLNKYSDIYIAASLLRHIVKLIPQDYIKTTLEKNILPTIFDYIFVDPPSAPTQTNEIPKLEYEILGLKTLA